MQGSSLKLIFHLIIMFFLTIQSVITGLKIKCGDEDIVYLFKFAEQYSRQIMGTFLFISGQEIFIIMLVVLLLFGADKIPEIAKGIGKGMRDFRKATDEIRKEIEDSTREVRREMSDIGNSLTKDAEEVSGNIQNHINDTTGSINSELQGAADTFQKHVDDIGDSVNSSGYDYNDYANPYQNPDVDYSNQEAYSPLSNEEAGAFTNETAEPAPQPETVVKPKRKYKPRAKTKPAENSGSDAAGDISS